MKKLLMIISLLFLMGSCLKEPDFHSYQVNLIVDFGTDFTGAVGHCGGGEAHVARACAVQAKAPWLEWRRDHGVQVSLDGRA